MFNIFSKKENGEVKTSKLSGAWGDGQAVLSAIDDGVVAIDPNGNIRIINPAAEQIIGWTSGDSQNLLFDSVLNLVDKDGKSFSREENPIRQALLNFSNFSSKELFLKTGAGKNIPISLTINPIDENHSGIVVVFRNIAKELEENRQQTEFISTASHEMRTPVASIEGYLGLALNPATATIDDRARGFLEKAHENTKHLGQLFQDLLDISKSEDGRLKNEPVVLDAVEFSRQIWDGLKSKAESKNLTYIFDLDSRKSGEKTLSPVYYIRSDRDHLHEVLDNLFENAIKYTPSGQVSVNVSGDNENVRISVTDSGIGIPAEDIPHLFQKFYRVDNSETREIGGTGLGLYLSRRLVESMGGKLTLESEYQKGSTFTVQLPRLTREQAEKFRAEEAQKPVEEASKKDEIFESAKEIFQAKVEQAKKEDQLLSQENISSQTSDSQTLKNEDVTDNPETGEVQNYQVPVSEDFGRNFAQSQVQGSSQTQQNLQNIQAQYLAQENAIREYQMQQYYARQKAAEDARIRAEQANLARAQQQFYSQARVQTQPVQAQNGVANPYFASNAQPQPSNYAQAQMRQNVQQYGAQNYQPQAQVPTLSEIEKMREEYVRKMMLERQNPPN